MGLVATFIQNPVKVAVGVLLVLLFGLLAAAVMYSLASSRQVSLPRLFGGWNADMLKRSHGCSARCRKAKKRPTCW